MLQLTKHGILEVKSRNVHCIATENNGVIKLLRKHT